MSLILEALKKSEAERQLGRAPGLMSPMVRVSKRRGPSPWWGVLGLALGIAAGAAWWSMREVTAPASRAVEATPPAPTPPAQVTRTTDTPAAVPSPPAVATPASPVAEPAPPTAGPLPSDPEFASVERESIPIAAPPTPGVPAPDGVVPPAPPARTPAPPVDATAAAPQSLPPADPQPAVPVATTPAPPQPAVPVAATPTPATPAVPPTAVPPLPAPPATSQSAPVAAQPPAQAEQAAAPPASLPAQTAPAAAAAEPAPPATAPTAEAPLEPLPTVAELMPDVRGALPAMKLTMHVYSADPAGRFVLIDGKRLVPGDQIAPSLSLAEIRRDGAVLEYAGKRFLVPRP